MSCLSANSNNKEQTLTEITNERKLWTPLGDYGSDSVYCISPPVVSEESKQIYDRCATAYKLGSFPVPETDRLVYDTFNQHYPGDDTPKQSS